MSQLTSIKRRKLVIALLFACATQISLGSFTGTVDEKAKSKYSLKNFNKTFYKKASPFSLTAGFQYKGTQVMNQHRDATGTSYNSMMRFEKGNTTYIYPYKHKVTVSVFKTPTPPTIR